MNLIDKLTDIINTVCSSDNINKYSDIKLRNKENGISAKDSIYYRLSYSQKV